MNQAKALGRVSNVRGSVYLMLWAVGAFLAVALCVTVMVAAATGATPITLPEMPWSSPAAPDKVALAKQELPPEIAPPSDPAALRPVSETDAIKLNAEIPLSVGPNPAAARFLAASGNVGNWARSLDCLTAAVYYEAASEGADGMRAVAQVVLNRVRHPAYPHTVCGVVFQGSERKTGCQFTFTCDGSLARVPSRVVWARAQAVAGAALGGYVYQPVGWSTHYHTNWVLPYWASSLVKTAVVGSHIFYRWTGGWGQPGAFSARYSGLEPALDWRAGDPAEAVDPAAAIAGNLLPGGQVATSIEERPVLASGTPAEGAAPSGAPAAASRAYVLADRRWVLGGVQSEDKPKPVAAAEPDAGTPAAAAATDTTR